jgi:four helix bundle protein
MRQELEKRLILFAVSLHTLCKELDDSFVATHLSNQLLRSVTGAALNYGEAQGAESRKDFIHKTSIVLKELRETHINLQILLHTGICNSNENIISLLDECNQLVSIFYKTIMTAKKNQKD